MGELLGVPSAVIIAALLAIYMAWAIGANDVANAMGTSVGSGALTLAGAVLVAGVLEFCGAFFAGAHVTDTVRKGILDASAVARAPEILLEGMLGALAAAATLLIVATRFGLPISTTHSIVGAIVGFGTVGFGFDAVAWSKVGQIVASWVTSPLIGGALAFGVFLLTRTLVLDREDPIASARRWGPFFFFVVFFVVGLVTLFKGLKNLDFDYDLPGALVRAGAFGLLGAVVGAYFLGRVRVAATDGTERRLRDVERMFAVLQVMTACAVAFAHGSNDVANAVGPMAAVIAVASGVGMGESSPVAPWMLAVGGVGIVLGLATWGYRVMETIGSKITELTPSRGFSAELGAALTIVLASRLGIPVSTTHILVGSVLGVGLARGIASLDLRVVGRILVSWVATLPLAAVLAIFFFHVFRVIPGL